MYIIGLRQRKSPQFLFRRHTTKDIAVKWEDEWGSKCFFSHGDSKSAGVSVMFRNGFDFKVNDSIFIDQNGRYIILDLTV